MAKPFTIGELIGTGGFGTVHHGTFRSSKVAIKKVQILRLDQRGPREYKSMKLLNHPNVLKLLHWQDDADFRFYTFHSFELKLINEWLNESGT